MIDWRVAEQVAGTVAGRPAPDALGVDLAAMARDSAERVSAYSGLSAAGLPEAEEVDRPTWIAANVTGFRDVMGPLSERAGRNLGPAPLQVPLRAAAGLLLGVEVGALLGYLSQRVLGQYELVLLEPNGPSRLLFVAPNLHQAIGALRADREELIRWVALHEVTHALQFGGVPWLREHMAALLRELLATVEVSLDASRALRLPRGDDLRAMVDTVRRGDLLGLVSSGAQRELLDRLQTTMAVIEGYAEHVMDAVGVEVLPNLPTLRAAFDRRRRSQSAPARLLNRLLGLELKLRQYEEGKRFCDRVAKSHGPAALHRVWSAPSALPSTAELADPDGWVARTALA